MERKKKPDLIILTCIFSLYLLGILTVTSSSYAVGQISKISFNERHIILSIFSFFLILFLIAIDVRKFFHKDFLLILYFISLFVLIGLYFVPEINDTHRFYKFYGFLFQPSEFIKILLILLAAKILSEKKYPNSLIFLSLTMIFPSLLILFQKDLGMTILILSSMFFMLFYKGIPQKHLIVILIASFVIVFISLIRSPYQIKRIKEFIEGSSEHQLAAKVALGSGHIFGKGLGKSHQKFFYLSMPHTDFAFSILGEEMGFVGSVIVLFIYGVIFFRGFLISTQLENWFLKLSVFGLTVMFTLNSLIHISVNVGIMPAKGITLPLISYGGSSMLSSSILLGIILSISMRKYEV